MDRTRRRLVIATSAFVAATLGWVAASYALGRGIEDELQTRLRAQMRPTGVRVLQLTHHAGIATSSGSAQIQLALGCTLASRRFAPFLQVEYEIEHGLLPTRLLHATFKARPLGIFGVDVRPFVGNDMLISGAATVGFDGATRLRAEAPELSRYTPHGLFKLAATRADVRVDARSFALSWLMPDLQFEGQRGRVHIAGLAWQWQLSDRARGVGRTWSTIEQLELPSANARGLAVATHGEQSGDRSAFRVRAQAAELHSSDVGGMRDAQLTAHVSGLDTDSFESMLALATDNCSVLSLLGEPAASWRHALRTITVRGLSLAVDQLSAQTPDGALRGDLSLELSPNTATGSGKPFDSVRATGGLQLRGASLTDRVRREPQLASFFREDAQSGLSSQLVFEQRALHVNGKPWNPLFVKLMLNLAEGMLGGGP